MSPFRPLSRATLLALALLLALPAGPAIAQDTAPPAEPVRGVSIEATTWSMVGFTADANRMTLGGRFAVDGPIANPWGHPARLYVGLDIAAVPGQAFDLASVETWGRSAELRLGTSLRIARATAGEQAITTSLYLQAGFATAIGDELLDRYLRHVQAGVLFEGGGASLRLGYCRAEAAGYIGLGQVCVAGQAPIPGSHGIAVLGGDAAVNLSRAVITPQRDIFRVYIGVSLDQGWQVIQGY